MFNPENPPIEERISKINSDLKSGIDASKYFSALDDLEDQLEFEKDEERRRRRAIDPAELVSTYNKPKKSPSETQQDK